MGWRGIVVLLALVLGLGAVLWFTDEKPKVQTVNATAVLGGRSLTECVSMRWQFAERPPIEIARSPDGVFRMQEPLQDVASAAHLKQIAVAWDSAQMRATPLADDEAGRTQAGLAPPEMVFTVSFPEQAPLVIEVGSPGPLGTTRFLRVHGKIWEGGEGLIESMRGNPDDLREKAVFRNAFGQAHELRVEQLTETGKRETLHLKLEKDGWQLLSPVQGRADPVAAQRFVGRVLGLRVDDFAQGRFRPPDREPRLDILVRGTHGEEQLKLWDDRLELYGLLPGRNVLFTSSSVQYADIFQNAAQSLRARILVPMGDTAFAEMVDLIVDAGQGQGERLHLHRETPDADWFLTEPVAFPAGATPANEAAHAVQILVAMEFVDDADAKRPRAEDPRYGLLPGQRLVVTLRSARERQTTTLWFGNETRRGEESYVHACRADEPDTVVLVPKAAVTPLQRSWLDYCALRIVKQTASVDRIDLARRDGGARTFQIEGGTWQLVGATGARAEVGDLVTDELVDLHGAKAVDARPAAFDVADWSLRLMRKSGDELGLLRFWDRPGEPLLVQYGEAKTPVAFALSARLSKDLRALWQ